MYVQKTKVCLATIENSKISTQNDIIPSLLQFTIPNYNLNRKPGSILHQHDQYFTKGFSSILPTKRHAAAAKLVFIHEKYIERSILHF